MYPALSIMILAGSPYASMHADIFEDFDQEFSHIEKSLEHMRQRLLKQAVNRKSITLNTSGKNDGIYASRVEIAPCKIQATEEEQEIVITVDVDKKIEPSDVSVQLEGDILTIAIPKDNNLELHINNHSMGYSSHQVVENEKKDEKDQVYFVSSEAAQLSQSALLPARITFTKTPQVDLTNGKLTIRLAKHIPQNKIIVTSSQAKQPENVKNKVAKKIKKTDEK